VIRGFDPAVKCCSEIVRCFLGGTIGRHEEIHYTTTPRLAMDDLTVKVVTGADDLTLKTYTDRLLLPV